MADNLQQKNMKMKELMIILKTIKTYSLNLAHPFFFNSWFYDMRSIQVLLVHLESRFNLASETVIVIVIVKKEILSVYLSDLKRGNKLSTSCCQDNH